MNNHIKEIVEFERIVKSLEELSVHEVPKIREFQFISESRIHSQFMERVAVLKTFIAEKNDHFHNRFPEIEDILDECKHEGSVLEGDDIASIMRHIVAVQDLRSFIGNEAPGFLSEMRNEIPDDRELKNKISTYFTPEGILKEDEIPELRRIKDKIKGINASLAAMSRKYLNNNQDAGIWSADVPAMRNGRLVLPLKSDFRGRVNGIIHDVSSTGQTVFIEPEEILRENNALAEADSEYHQKIHAIYRDCTAEIRRAVPDLQHILPILKDFDDVYVRARYAAVYDCTPVNITSGAIRLNQSRHPHLGKSAVPVDIFMPAGTRVLIITGPNTGGKTVALKTLGIFSIMSAFGMELPCSDGSELPLFSDVFGDIGDEQSIEASLSTFSGHMRNIGRILDSADENSLVLLDELGSGTDPDQGSALSMAILDKLLERNCYVAITTHMTVLKNYGFTRDQVENASMEFDEAEHRPTYKLVPGIPGSSHAIEIAAREGLQPEIVEKAHSYAEGRATDLGALISELTAKLREVEDEKKNLLAEQRAAKLRVEQAEQAEAKAKELEIELKEAGIRDISTFLKETRSELERTLRELREQGIKVQDQKAMDLRRKIEDKNRQLEESIKKDSTNLKKHDIIVYTQGMNVKIKGTGKKGILERNTKKGYWMVQIGSMRMEMPEKNLLPADDGGKKFEYEGPSVAVTKKAPAFELDLRGCRYELAMQRLEEQIDNCVISGLREFSVIHGMGTGALQQGVQTYLRQRPEVKEFAYAHPESGGFGKTVVSLK